MQSSFWPSTVLPLPLQFPLDFREICLGFPPPLELPLPSSPHTTLNVRFIRQAIIHFFALYRSLLASSRSLQHRLKSAGSIPLSSLNPSFTDSNALCSARARALERLGWKLRAISNNDVKSGFGLNRCLKIYISSNLRFSLNARR